MSAAVVEAGDDLRPWVAAFVARHGAESFESQRRRQEFRLALGQGGPAATDFIEAPAALGVGVG
jgi:hypothetical protein